MSLVGEEAEDDGGDIVITSIEGETALCMTDLEEDDRTPIGGEENREICTGGFLIAEDESEGIGFTGEEERERDGTEEGVGLERENDDVNDGGDVVVVVVVVVVDVVDVDDVDDDDEDDDDDDDEEAAAAAERMGEVLAEDTFGLNFSEFGLCVVSFLLLLLCACVCATVDSGVNSSLKVITSFFSSSVKCVSKYCSVER